MEEKIFIINNFSKKEFLELSKNYEYIVICRDNFLSGWECNHYRKHYLMILCKTSQDMEYTRSVLETRKARNNEFSYINWYPLAKKTNRYIDNIMKYKYKYSVSLRNDKFIA